MKIVVFDLDETLGYFTQFGILWDSLNNYFQSKNINLSQDDFNNLLDLYPEVLRPNIITILKYLKSQKNNKCCSKIMIYTNNNGSPSWANHIISYFERKIGGKLIDQVISAFKISNKRVELCRTTHDKTYNDLLRCSKVTLSTEICFIDDKFFPEMINDNIYYINIKPYYYDLSFEELLTRIREKKILKRFLKEKNDDFEIKLIKQLNLYNYNVLPKNKDEYTIDKILGKQILFHLKDFFKS